MLLDHSQLRSLSFHRCSENASLKKRKHRMCISGRSRRVRSRWRGGHRRRAVTEAMADVALPAKNKMSLVNRFQERIREELVRHDPCRKHDLIIFPENQLATLPCHE